MKLNSIAGEEERGAKLGLLRRFSLYGFLKNQQYYDPFLVLAFLQMGLSYTLIGTLVAFREVVVNLAEIPTGAIADLFGRRKSMIFSFVSYIVSFVMMGTTGLNSINRSLPLGTTFLLLMAAMVFFAVGDAFRTGTHKAMIFTWLRIQNRTHEKTKIYGHTRSWSKIGSAVSVVLASFFVFFSRNFIFIFFFSIVPYILNIINFLGYPKEVDGDIDENAKLSDVWRHLRESLLVSARNIHLRRIISESMGFGGFFKAVKDYLQPILEATALPLAAALFAGVAMTNVQQSVILIGPVYLVLFLISAVSSRKSHLFVKKPGGEDRTARMLWGALSIIMIILLPAMFFDLRWVIIVGYVILYSLQNIWRPVLISRFDSYSEEGKGATILSIESQAKSIATMAFAPIIGLLVDLTRKNQIGAGPFWPIALIGCLLAILFFATGRTRSDVRTPAA